VLRPPFERPAAQLGEAALLQHVDPGHHGARGALHVHGGGHGGLDGLAAQAIRAALSVGVHAVREEDDRDAALRVDPQGRAGEARVAHRRAAHRAQVRAGALAGRRALLGRDLAGQQQIAHRARGEDALAGERASAHQHAREPAQIERRREQPRVPRDPAQGPRPRIVHAAEQHDVAQTLRGRGPRGDARRR
jgi:hypothetical protein